MCLTVSHVARVRFYLLGPVRECGVSTLARLLPRAKELTKPGQFGTEQNWKTDRPRLIQTPGGSGKLQIKVSTETRSRADRGNSLVVHWLGL